MSWIDNTADRIARDAQEEMGPECQRADLAPYIAIGIRTGLWIGVDFALGAVLVAIIVTVLL